MIRFAVATISLAVLIGSFAFAQGTTSKVQVFGGYSLLHADNGRLNGTLLDVNLSPPHGMGNLVVMNLVSDIVGLGFPRQSRYGFVLSMDGVELDCIRVEVGTPIPTLGEMSSEKN